MSQEITQINETFDKNVDKLFGKPEEAKGDTLFHRIANFDLKVLEFAIGDLGKALKEFCGKVAIDHPALKRLHDGSFSQPEMIQKIDEAIKIAEFSLNNDMHIVSSQVKEQLVADLKPISKTLLKPPPRTLLSAKDRNKARNVSKSKELDLSRSYELGPEAWDRHPDTFCSFVRMSSTVADEIEYGNKICSLFNGMGLTSHATFLTQELRKLRDGRDKSYYGFYALNMQSAAIILAKSLGYQWNNKNYIEVSEDVFPHKFWSAKQDEDKNLDLPGLEDETVIRSPERRDSRLWYSPRFYPYSKFLVEPSSYIKSLIEKLESHPDVSGKPLFDQYWVVVPSVSVKHFLDGKSFHNGEKVLHFGGTITAQRALDRHLVEKKFVQPILMAENKVEQESYFLCYWV